MIGHNGIAHDICCWEQDPGPITTRLLERRLVVEITRECKPHNNECIGVELTKLGHLALGLYSMMKASYV